VPLAGLGVGKKSDATLLIAQVISGLEWAKEGHEVSPLRTNRGQRQKKTNEQRANWPARNRRPSLFYFCIHQKYEENAAQSTLN
jgi:hypothetical protein